MTLFETCPLLAPSNDKAHMSPCFATYSYQPLNFLNKAIGIINFAKHFQNFIDDTMI